MKLTAAKLNAGTAYYGGSGERISVGVVVTSVQDISKNSHWMSQVHFNTAILAGY